MVVFAASYAFCRNPAPENLVAKKYALAHGLPPTPFSMPSGDGCLEQQPTAGGLDTHAPPLPLQATAPTPGPNILPPLPAPTTRALHSSSLASGAEKGADWLERAQLTCVSLLAVARRFACCAPPTSTRSLETKLRTDRVALATFVAGTDPLAAAAERTIPPCLAHQNNTHSRLTEPTITSCVGPAAA